MTRSIEPTPRRCAVCGDTFEAKYARTCQPCASNKRLSALWNGRKKYVWTPEKDAYLRQHYDGKIYGRAAKIAAKWGWPKWAIKKRAAQLALCYPADRRDWTAEEEAFLEVHTGRRTVVWMARKLKRSDTSVVLKLKRMGISRRYREGFTVADLSVCFGVDHHTVDRWIDKGFLRARRRGTNWTHDAHVVTENDIVRFVRERPMEFRLDKVDQLFFMDLVIGGGLLRPSDERLSGSAFTRERASA